LKKILTLKLYITLWETYSKRIVFLCWSNVFTIVVITVISFNLILKRNKYTLLNFIWKYFNAFNNGRRQ